MSKPNMQIVEDVLIALTTGGQFKDKHEIAAMIGKHYTLVTAAIGILRNTLDGGLPLITTADHRYGFSNDPSRAADWEDRNDAYSVTRTTTVSRVDMAAKAIGLVSRIHQIDSPRPLALQPASEAA